MAGMKPRRGTKANPFEVGERVRIFPEGYEGEVVMVKDPPFRGHIHYLVAYEIPRPGQDPLRVTDKFHSTRLELEHENREKQA